MSAKSSFNIIPEKVYLGHVYLFIVISWLKIYHNYRFISQYNNSALARIEIIQDLSKGGVLLVLEA